MVNSLEMKLLLGQDQDSINGPLAAYEKNVFDARNNKAQHDTANDIAPDSLRYLFGIFN